MSASVRGLGLGQYEEKFRDNKMNSRSGKLTRRRWSDFELLTTLLGTVVMPARARCRRVKCIDGSGKNRRRISIGRRAESDREA
jgi:hypothetical protein